MSNKMSNKEVHDFVGALDVSATMNSVLPGIVDILSDTELNVSFVGASNIGTFSSWYQDIKLEFINHRAPKAYQKETTNICLQPANYYGLQERTIVRRVGAMYIKQIMRYLTRDINDKISVKIISGMFKGTTGVLDKTGALKMLDEDGKSMVLDYLMYQDTTPIPKAEIIDAQFEYNIKYTPNKQFAPVDAFKHRLRDGDHIVILVEKKHHTNARMHKGQLIRYCYRTREFKYRWIDEYGRLRTNTSLYMGNYMFKVDAITAVDIESDIIMAKLSQ